MTASQTMQSSEDVRKEGNDLYMSGKFEEAAALYERAAKLAPEEAAPLSNLAATHFELGRYEACMKVCSAASGLLVSGDGTAEADLRAKQLKLSMREAKAALYAMQLDRVEDVLQRLSAGEEKLTIQKCFNQLRSNQTRDAKAVHTRLILELPRYKPMIRNVPEYFVFGHDAPESLYEFNDKLLHSNRKKISFLFGGIGDARNLHRTLVSIAMQDKWKSEIRDSGKCFHFTVNDHKPAVIARDILILLILHETSTPVGDSAEEDDEMEEMISSGLFPLLYYTYLAPIMPKLFYDVLQSYVRRAIGALEGKKSLPSFLDVPQMYRADILKVLRQWQSEAQEEYPTARVRREAVRTRERDRMQQTLRNGAPGLVAPKDCKKQEEFYLKTGILFLDFSHERLLGEELNASYSEFDQSSPGTPSAALLKHVDTTWRTNVTFVDLDWQRNREGWDGSDWTAASHMDIDVAHNPFELAIKLADEGLVAPDVNGLFHRTLDWFHSVARSMKQLRGRYIIEACVGDVSSVLEQIRHGVVGHRQEPETVLASGARLDPAVTVLGDPQANKLSVYPLVYDRIHFSNIPDYVGGSLTSFMYALPVTYPGEASYITSCCLRNPPRFRTPRHFNNDYIGLSADADLEKVLHTRMEPLPYPDDSTLIMTEYLRWHHCETSTKFGDLMPRVELETWLYRLFLKLTIPKERAARDFVLIYSPLNLTAFLRLCSHLHHIGYPAHWIGGVLADILSGKITTKARPPRSEPLTIKEVKDEAYNKSIEQSTAPFVAELSTLVSLWQQASALPFGIFSSGLPDVEMVHKYSITFGDVPDIIAETPSFMLLFFDAGLLPPNSGSLRPYLLSDEKADRSPRARAIRTRGLHVLSTWEWQRERKTASFWLRKDVFERFDDRNWGLAIWRTDNWIRQSPPQKMSDVHDLGAWLQD